MSNEQTETQQTVALSPTEANLIFILRKTISDKVAASVKGEREDVFTRLKSAHDETGAKQLSVKLPSGTEVAKITLQQPKEQTHVDNGRLLSYLRDGGLDDYLEVIEHPAQEAWSETRVLNEAAAVAHLTENAAWIEGHPVTEEGEMLEFITRTVGEPKSFTVTYAKGGQDRVISEWLDGNLAHLNPGEELPQIGA